MLSFLKIRRRKTKKSNCLEPIGREGSPWWSSNTKWRTAAIPVSKEKLYDYVDNKENNNNTNEDNDNRDNDKQDNGNKDSDNEDNDNKDNNNKDNDNRENNN